MAKFNMDSVMDDFDFLKQKNSKELPEKDNKTNIEAGVEEKTSKEKTPSVVPESQQQIDTSKYEGKIISFSLLLSDEINEYITIRSIQLEKTQKTFLKEIIIDEIENGTPDELVRKYRKPHPVNVKKTIQIEEGVRDAINEASKKYALKKTCFVAYALEKHMLNDKEYMNSNI